MSYWLKKWVSRRRSYQFFFIFIFNFIQLWLFYWVDQNDIIWAIGVGSLASSSCIVFGKPRLKAAHPLSIVLTYSIAMIVGVSFHFIALLCPPIYLNLFSALAVVTTFFVLAWKRLAHPPALGIALVLVLRFSDYLTPLVILFCVAILLVMRDVFLYITKH